MFNILMILRKFLSKINNKIVLISGAFWFTFENYKKRYPYVLLGEKQLGLPALRTKETVLLYRITGKRYIVECSATDLCNSKDLIGKFHPLDVRIISFIAGVEQILKVMPEDRTEKFELLKEYIFN